MRSIMIPLFCVGAILALGVGARVMWVFDMPGQSYPGRSAPALDGPALGHSVRLRGHVDALASGIGERNLAHPGALSKARDYLVRTLQEMGHTPRLEAFTADGHSVSNVMVELPGKTAPAQIVIFGAHYDTAAGSPGANDNATGVAVLLELARELKDAAGAYTLRLIWFVNEEPPYFRTPNMGSIRHAKRAEEQGEVIRAVIALESLGYYTDEPDSQRYPSSMIGVTYPDTGNFVAFVGNTQSRTLVRDSIREFRRSTPIASEGLAAPDGTPGIDDSDHASFWRLRIPAIMITDTAHFRDPHYHRPTDQGDQVDFTRLTHVARGVATVARSLSNARD